MSKDLRTALAELDRDAVPMLVAQRLEADDDPLAILGDCRAGMTIVGERFQEGEYFLSELIISAELFKQAVAVLEPHLSSVSAQSPVGKVVLATMRGDIHDLGKNLLVTLLRARGFEVHDLGEDVPPQEFVNKAQEVGADVVGISALISLAVSKMAETVAILKQSGIPAKVIVGGAAVTRETAETIGADAHGNDAWEALRRVRGLVQGVQGELQT